MGLARAVPWSHRQQWGQPRPGQGGFHRPAGHGRRVVLPAEMGQDNLRGPGLRQGHGEGGGVPVAQVPPGAQNAPLQIIGIGTAFQGLHVVVGLQHRHVHAGENLRRLGRNRAGVRQQTQTALLCVKPPAAGPRRVVGGGEGGDPAVRQGNSAAERDLPQAAFRPGEPLRQGLRCRGRGEEGTGRSLQKGLEAGNMVAVGVGDENAVQVSQGRAQRPQALFHPAAGPGDQGGVAGRAAGKGMYRRQKPPPPFRFPGAVRS